MMKEQLISQLFRSEFSKIIAVLCKNYGLSNIQLAEDIVSDTFLKATETWKLKGIPDNPKAWLYYVAKNTAKDYFKRNSVFLEKVLPHIEPIKESDIEIDLSTDNIDDSQLKMLFAVSNPIISKESQITFALRVLCGLGIDEIASALLTTKSTINKRLFRTKETLKEKKVKLILPPETELLNRLDSVLATLYLLFNEGYYSCKSDNSIQKELCIESMRLLFLLINNKSTNLPHVQALMALFCFHASRFDARTAKDGAHILYNQQDKNKWDDELIEKGNYFLFSSEPNIHQTRYHLEAMISYWHAQKEVHLKTKWDTILQLYNRLIQIEYSPVTALNRTYALAMVQGKNVALKEALKINLTDHHLYHSLLADLYSESNTSKQKEHLNMALSLAKSSNDKQLIKSKIQSLDKQ